MNKAPTPMGALSLWEVLEQMDDFHMLPDSAVVAADGTDVFVSFHWKHPTPWLAAETAAKLREWLEKAVTEMGAVAVEEDDEGLNG